MQAILRKRTLVRGWYWGTEQFKEVLLSRANRKAVKRNRNYQTSQMGRDHAQEEAEELVRLGLKKYKLKEEALEGLPGSDERKVAIAESIHRNTTVSQGWISERLGTYPRTFIKSALIKQKGSATNLDRLRVCASLSHAGSHSPHFSPL